MIRFHPSIEQLTQYAQGTLSPAESIMVSAHCDMCGRCKKVVLETTENMAAQAFDFSSHDSMLDEQLGAMLSNITMLPEMSTSGSREQTSNPLSVEQIELDGKVFAIPRTLQTFAGKIGNWSGLVGKLWQAPVDLGYSGVANFIYMSNGGSVPEHTHRGVEFTLVLDGEFSDGLHHYRTGDFIKMDGEHTHAPQSTHPSGCLVFSILDQPLHFTSGIARLLNPFSHLFFK